MCIPSEDSVCSTVDRFRGHRTVSQAFAKYIAFAPVLQCRSSRRASTQPQEAFDLYVARVVHDSQVPENVPYTALYLLASMSQSCSCRPPQEGDSDEDDRPTPSRISHVLSQATTRTPFSRIAKSHWTERHIFIGVFVIALLAYANTLSEEEAKGMRCWSTLSDVSGISCEEIEKISRAFDKGICSQLRTKIEKMLWEGELRNMAEVICPHVTARQERLSQAAEAGKEKFQKRRMSLKRSVSSFWKPSEKATPVVSEEPESDWDSESLDFRCHALSPSASYSPA